MAVKMGEFLGILMNITNKQTNQAYPEDDVRTKFKNQRVIGLIGVSERKKPGKNFIKIFDPINDRSLTTGIGELHWEDEESLLHVSYTHLDVYKRQVFYSLRVRRPSGNSK